jgi:hydrogenase expression/formation protein HypC
MCLGVPGQVVSMESDPDGLVLGRVRFGGISREVCLSYVPDVRIGDYVVVHVGFAITIVDAAEAERTMAFLEAMGDLDGLDGPEPPDEAAALDAR